ncbi:MAG: DNA cytosine methyltransferase [Pirellulales bacterium]
MSPRTHHAVSLFSNCGAGDVGYARAGFHFDVMAELDPRRLEVCLLNHPHAGGVPGDLRETWPKVVRKYRSRVGKTRPSLLAACPPCQGMSSARSERGSESDPDAGMRDERNLLVTVIAKVAQELRPRLIVVENVQAFLTRQVRHPETNRPISAAKLLIEHLAEDYEVFPFLTDLCHYGVPQTRKRAFLTFVHREERSFTRLLTLGRAPYPIPSHLKGDRREPITVKDALLNMKLPSLDAALPETASSRIGGGLHAVPVWQDRRYDMVAAIPPYSGRSAWDNDDCNACGHVSVDDDDAECPCCHTPLLRPVMKKSRGGYRLITGFRSSTYARMHSDRPAATVTTASGHIGSNNTIHPFENRVLSMLECALLQTFPRRFNWGDALRKWGHTNVREMIGEAVPPLFTRAHGHVLRAILEGRLKVRMYDASDTWSRNAAKKIGLVTASTKKR